MPWRRRLRSEKLAIYIALFARRIRTMAAGWIYLQSSRSHLVLTFSYLTASVFPGVYDINCFDGIRRAPLPGGRLVPSVRYAESRGKCQMRIKTLRVAIKLA